MKKLILLLVAGFIFATSAQAKEAFTEAAFKQAQAQNEVILIDIFATWCPTCKKQNEIIAEYFAAHPDSKIKTLVVDYDDQKEWVTYFKAPRQSTLLIYQGKKQLWFSVAQTKKDVIFAQLSAADAL